MSAQLLTLFAAVALALALIGAAVALIGAFADPRACWIAPVPRSPADRPTDGAIVLVLMAAVVLAS